MTDRKLFELASERVDQLKRTLIVVRQMLLNEGYHYPNEIICLLTDEIGDDLFNNE